MMPDANRGKKIKVLLVEDHPMLRERLGQLINKSSDMEVCGEADNVQVAMALVQERTPDIAVVDVSLRDSNGLELLKEMGEQKQPVPVLILSMHDEPIYAERALAAGARGYISKSEASAEVMRAIRKVLNGDVYLNEAMTSELIGIMSGHGGPSPAAAIGDFSDRELQVFRLIGEGKNTHEIARQLGVGESTIATVRVRIKQKIGAKDVAELYHLATEWTNDQEHVLM